MKTIFKVILFFSILLLLSACDDSYTIKSSIHGIIMDSTNNYPIEGALVTNQTTGKNCVTSTNGIYEFNNLEFGKTYKIYVEKDGYIPSSQSITPYEVRDKIELNIRLERRP